MLELHGVLMDTVRFELRLPEEKIQRLQSLLNQWHSKSKHTRGELEKLLDHLSHTATVIQPGRIFLRELFTLLHSVKGPDYFFAWPNKGAKTDLAWWRCFLQNWNGSSFFASQFMSIQMHHIVLGVEQWLTRQDSLKCVGH